MEVWSVLGDPTKRAAYDEGRTVAPAPPPPGTSARELFGSILDAVFGVADHRPRPGRDLLYRLTLTLAEAARGAHKAITVPATRPCDACHGRGFPPGAVPALCPRCGGAGEVRARAALRASREVCDACGGRGYQPDPPCSACGGAGLTPSSRVVDVTVPSGTRDGARLLVRGAGEPGLHGGPPGDLLLACSVAPHPTLRREGRDVLMDLTISALDAMLGATVTVPTVLGPRALEVPAGTTHGVTLRLPGLGVASPDGSPRDGAQLVTVQLSVPAVGAGEARARLEAARDLLQREPLGGAPVASHPIDDVPPKNRGPHDG